MSWKRYIGPSLPPYASCKSTFLVYGTSPLDLSRDVTMYSCLLPLICLLNLTEVGVRANKKGDIYEGNLIS